MSDARTRSRNAPAGPSPFAVAAASLPHEKFSDPQVTAKGEPRASVPLKHLDTLWLNTGTLCNLACASCYIESSPTMRQSQLLTQFLLTAVAQLSSSFCKGGVEYR